MPLARWKDLCLDAEDPVALGTFWGTILGLEVHHLDDGDVVLRGASPDETIWVNRVPESKTVKHRLHVDVHTRSVDDLVRAGATVLEPASEAGFPWTILADPEGGEFCAFVRDPWEHDAAARPYEFNANTTGYDRAVWMARWWAEVFGTEAEAVPDHGFAWTPLPDGLVWEGIVVAPVPEPKVGKNRVHWDVTTDDVEALVQHGATVLAEPTEATPWHVLADPDGNEFCAFPST